MLHGTRQVFDYFQCAACGCLQIAQLPTNLSDYYPAGYFSFRDYTKLAHRPLRAWLDRRRVRCALTGRGWIGTVANRFAKPLDYVDWLKTAGLGLSARVLDVGCGSGRLLLRMRLGGLEHLTGVDPFLAGDLRYPNGLVIRKQSLADTAGTFDLIMFHHAYEHMAHPQQVLIDAAQRLAPGGSILIRIPVVDCVAWERYREHWCHLDAPRHLYLHSRRSLTLLAARAGLEIYASFCDSTPSQFLLSELYQRDIPQNAGVRPEQVLGRQTLAESRRLTQRLNQEGRGDTAGFFLRRKAPSAP